VRTRRREDAGGGPPPGSDVYLLAVLELLAILELRRQVLWLHLTAMD